VDVESVGAAERLLMAARTSFPYDN
jgi:hypothetical protein